MQGVLNKEPRKSRRRVSTREVATRYRDSPRNERGGARVRARVYTRVHTGEHRATRAPRQRKPESSRSPTQCVSPGTRLSEITTLHTCPYRAVQGTTTRNPQPPTTIITTLRESVHREIFREWEEETRVFPFHQFNPVLRSSETE